MATAAKAMRWGALGAVGAAIRSASSPDAPGVMTRLLALPRMVLAIRRGEYTGTDLRRVLLMLAAAGYVVSPVDLAPEALLFLGGLADDALVIGWLAVTIIRVTDDFLEWERNRGAVPGEVVR
ncbi:MAG TPA: DUF1232 domain-containing protein [Ornithinicoccus sp.]|nr:DUF1232 domain-containing protein [Ornithinicoccus sp.]